MTTTPEEARDNRKAFLKALREDDGTKCSGQLFFDEHYEATNETKHFNCAIGLACKVFFGINSEAAYREYLQANPDFQPYDAVAEKLGIQGLRVVDPLTGMRDDVIDYIWKRNDRSRASFRTLAKDYAAAFKAAE